MTGRALKVFIYHLDNDQEVVAALKERLELENLETSRPGTVDFDAFSVESDEEGGQVPAGKDPLRNLVQRVDVVLFCLSDWYQDVNLEESEWRQVLAAALDKRQGDLFVIPVCLEPCELPAAFKRWQPIKLYQPRGFEDLMLALQVRAERVGVKLSQQHSWRENPFVTETEVKIETKKEAEPETSAPRGSCALGGLFILVVLFVAVAGVQFFSQLNTERASGATQTERLVNALAETATQNVVADSTERAATVTARALTARVPIVQTEIYNTGVALTLTIASFPTITPTPTYTAIVTSPPTRVVDTRNTLMALVPAGEFTLGWEADADASPVQALDLPAFYIDLYEVTNAEYQQCVTAGTCVPPASSASQTRPAYYSDAEFQNHPVLNVNWSMAQAFCAWRGARLPTEAEWEKAARGAEARLHPWGDETGCLFANHAACLGDTTAVDKYVIGVNEYGLYNLAGNAAEWTSSLWMPYPYAAGDGREDPASTAPRVLRGGSWASPAADIFTYRRLSLDPSTTSNEVGFRCARDVTS